MSSSLPRISIVTPSLDQAAFLGEALTSVVSQNYPEYEHLVFDGGSHDDTVELLKGFAAASPGEELRWRSGPDGGQSDALNQGFAMASGEIVGWLNADDRYRPDCFERVAMAFAAHPEVDVLYGDYTLIDENGKHVALRREIEYSRFILRYHRVLYIPTTAAFFRRRIFDDGHFLLGSLHYAMDLDFFLRLSNAGYTFLHLPEVLADFRVHSGSKSVQFIDRQKIEHRYIVLRETPLAGWFRSMRLRNAAATSLQAVAAILRYSEKLCRGFYFSDSAFNVTKEQPSGRVEGR